MKQVLVFIAGCAVVIAFSWILNNGFNVGDVWYQLEDLTRSKPLYCEEVDDPDDYRRAMEHLERDFRDGKDVTAICAD